MVIPPTFREQKATQHQHATRHITPFHHTSYALFQSSLSSNNNREDCGSDIPVIAFRVDGDEDAEVSVIIEDPLSLDSTMECVMVEGDVFDDLGRTINIVNGYRIQIMKKSGERLTLKWSKFRNLKFASLIHLNSIDTDYIINLKEVIV